MRKWIERGYLCIGALQLLFIVLKVAGVISWPWTVYLIPIVVIVLAKLVTKSILMKTF